MAGDGLHAVPERVDDELLRVLRVSQKELQRVLLLTKTIKYETVRFSRAKMASHHPTWYTS